MKEDRELNRTNDLDAADTEMSPETRIFLEEHAETELDAEREDRARRSSNPLASLTRVTEIEY